MDTFIKRLSNCFDDENVSIDLNKKFLDQEGWDSLTAFVIIDMLDEEYSYSISFEDLAEKTVHDLFNLINGVS